MRTQVLSKPAPVAVRNVPPPAVRRPASPPAPIAAPAVSSTAKTADLRGKLKASSSPSAPPRPVPVRSPAVPPSGIRPPARKPDAQVKGISRPVAAKPAVASQRNGVVAAPIAVANVPAATLICRNQSLRFTVPGVRAVIGRHLSAEDSIDIDLGVLKVGADRVSRRHAEIIKRGDDYYIRDLGSRNGTFIAGRGRLGRDQTLQVGRSLASRHRRGHLRVSKRLSQHDHLSGLRPNGTR